MTSAKRLFANHTATIQWVLLIVLSMSSTASASSGGITTSGFPNPPLGCNVCHTAGTVPTVTLTGPSVVAPSSTHEYTLTVFEVGSQDHAGLNVSAAEGVLSTGGAFATNTQAVTDGGSGLDEITHTAPKPAVSGMTEFSFLWTAPSSFTSVTLSGWGNAVNANSSTSGDRAANTTLEVFAVGVDTPTSTPTPTATPTPTPTDAPDDVCAENIDPLDPTLVTDPNAQKCQKAIGKAGFLYTKKKLKAVQSCLNDLQKGKLNGDPVDVCRGTLVGMVYTPPLDSKTADKVQRASDKAHSLIDKSCTSDALVAQLDACGATVADLKACLILDHWQLVDALVGHQYGALAQTSDVGEQKCQKTISGEAGKAMTKTLRAMQKCLDKRNKQGTAGAGDALCVGEIAAGLYVPPNDTKTADKISKAEDKLGDKLPLKCTGLQVDSLDACASTVTLVEECLICTHRAAVFDMLASQYGGN